LSTSNFFWKWEYLLKENDYRELYREFSKKLINLCKEKKHQPIKIESYNDFSTKIIKKTYNFYIRIDEDNSIKEN